MVKVEAARKLREREPNIQRFALNPLGPDIARDLELLEALGLKDHPGIRLGLKVRESLGLALGVLMLKPEDQMLIRAGLERHFANVDKMRLIKR